MNKEETKNQAIKLLKEFGFEGVKAVTIVKQGDSLILSPKGKPWLSMVDTPKADDDFLISRDEVFE